MGRMREHYDHNKRHILQAGHALIAQKGYTGVGLAEILAAAQIPKGADMASYGYVKQAKVVVDPALVQRASKEELALFLAMLCDLYWTPGLDDWFPPPLPTNQTSGGA